MKIVSVEFIVFDDQYNRCMSAVERFSKAACFGLYAISHRVATPAEIADYRDEQADIPAMMKGA